MNLEQYELGRMGKVKKIKMIFTVRNMKNRTNPKVQNGHTTVKIIKTKLKVLEFGKLEIKMLKCRRQP